MLIYFIRNITNLLPSLPYEDKADKRTEKWFLVDSLLIVAILDVAYLIIVFYLRKWMQRRKAFDIKELLLAYNLAMLLLNANIFIDLAVNSTRLQYNYFCQPSREIYSTEEMKIANAVWWFYFSKFLEFSDTIFFILRKKWEQLTFLHIYHHGSMFPLWWIIIKWVPTGSSFLPALINSFVHVVMYTYYGLSAFGPKMQNYLWWKKYLTSLQLLQFTIGVLWAFQAIIFECEYPRWINYATIIYMTTFLLLFGQFYKQKYFKKTNNVQSIINKQK